MINIDNGNVIKAFDKMKYYINQMKENKGKLGFSSHYPQIDELTSGIIPGKVYTIAAYSNVGKSRFSYGYVNHFLEIGKKVLFLSLEVDKGLLIQHLVCNKYNVYQNHINIDNIDVLDFQNLLIYDDVYKMNDIEELINEIKPDVCFIDFVQNIQSEGGEYERMAGAARKIQELSIKNNTTIFCLSQLSNTVARDVTKGNTEFVALKGAGEFVASSDVIFLLRMVDSGLGLTIVKNKFGRRPGGEILFECDFARSKFSLLQDPFMNKEVF